MSAQLAQALRDLLSYAAENDPGQGDPERDDPRITAAAEALAAHEAEQALVALTAEQERLGMYDEAAPQQAQAPGWQLSRVSDGDIRVYGPDKETWLIRKDCGEGFYDFIHRYFDAAIGAAPQQGSKS